MRSVSILFCHLLGNCALALVQKGKTLWQEEKRFKKLSFSFSLFFSPLKLNQFLDS